MYEYPNHYTLKKNRLIVLDEANKKCAKCGGKATIAHHKDLSKSNHNLDNLEPLCNKCHCLLHGEIKRNNPHLYPQRSQKQNKHFLEQIRIKLDLPYKKMAEEMNISLGALYKIIWNNNKPKEQTAKKINIWLEKNDPITQ